MYRYIKIKLKDGTTRDEHRLIMEKYLGRRLNRYECVHHKDGNGRNNAFENLEIVSLSEHSRQHQSGYKNARHGYRQMYDVYKCRCELCKKWRSNKHKKYRQRKEMV